MRLVTIIDDIHGRMQYIVSTVVYGKSS